MDTVTLNKTNRLFWLGRYAERVYNSVELIRDVHDRAIDGEVDVADLCRRMDMREEITTPQEFCRRYAFDKTIPESALSSAEAMLGNGMVLREIIGSQTLSYLQMATSALEGAAASHSSGVEFQWVLDDIMAFRGSYTEYIDAEGVRNTIRCGGSVERVSNILRFGGGEATLKKELHKLINRLYKTRLIHDKEKLAVLTEYAFGEGGRVDRNTLLGSVESLFLI